MKQVRLNYIFLSIRCRERSMPSAPAEVIALAKGLALEIKPSFLSSNRFELEAPAHMISAQSWPLLPNIHPSNSRRSTLPRPLFSLIAHRLLDSVAMGIKLSGDTRGRRRACWSINLELLGKAFLVHTWLHLSCRQRELRCRRSNSCSFTDWNSQKQPCLKLHSAALLSEHLCSHHVTFYPLGWLSQKFRAPKSCFYKKKSHYLILKRIPSTSLSLRAVRKLLMFQIMTKSLSGGPFCSILGVNVGLMRSMSYRRNHFN